MDGLELILLRKGTSVSEECTLETLRVFKSKLVRPRFCRLLETIGTSDEESLPSIHPAFQVFVNCPVSIPEANVSMLTDANDLSVISVNEDEALKLQFKLLKFEIARTEPPTGIQASNFPVGIPVLYAHGEMLNASNGVITSIAIPVFVVNTPSSMIFDNVKSDVPCGPVDNDRRRQYDEDREREYTSYTLIPQWINRIFSETNTITVGPKKFQTTVDVLAFVPYTEPALIEIEAIIERYLNLIKKGKISVGMTEFIRTLEHEERDLLSTFMRPNSINVEDARASNLRHMIAEILKQEGHISPFVDEPVRDVSSHGVMIVRDGDRTNELISMEDLQLLVIVAKVFDKPGDDALSSSRIAQSIVHHAESGQLNNRKIFVCNSDDSAHRHTFSEFISDSGILEYVGSKLEPEDLLDLDSLCDLISLTQSAKCELMARGSRAQGANQQSFGLLVKCGIERAEFMSRILLWAIYHDSIVCNRSYDGGGAKLDDVLTTFVGAWRTSKLKDGPSEHLGRPLNITFGCNTATVKVALNEKNKLENRVQSAFTDGRINLNLSVITSHKMRLCGFPPVQDFINFGVKAKGICLQGCTPFVLPLLVGTDQVSTFDVIAEAVQSIARIWNPSSQPPVRLVLEQMIELIAFHIGICISIIRSYQEDRVQAWMTKLFVPLGLPYLSNIPATWYLLIMHMQYCVGYLDILVQQDNEHRLDHSEFTDKLRSYMIDPVDSKPIFIEKWLQLPDAHSKRILLTNLKDAGPNSHSLSRCIDSLPSEGPTHAWIDIVKRSATGMTLSSAPRPNFSLLSPNSIYVNELATALKGDNGII
eukprot:GHVH01004583.1.p1 GENE.GHVH01004583.1~~GHVH01004583.1.p1  ORF type:complete len:819 (-),score=105.99 GHVH01004583.1:59-2515(-)